MIWVAFWLEMKVGQNMTSYWCHHPTSDRLGNESWVDVRTWL